MLYLRTHATLLAQLKAAQRDSSNNRWTNAEMTDALNDALLSWANRVIVPAWYALTWSDSERAYTLPAWMHPPFRPQTCDLDTDDPDTDGSSVTWHDVPAYTVEPSGTGAWVIRWGVRPRNVLGRVGYNMVNGPLLATQPALQTSMGSTDASIVLTGALSVPDAGFVQVENEYMAYNGVTPETNTTLTNVSRGFLGTTPAAHSTPLTVYQCVAAPQQELFSVLLDHARAYLHELYLSNGAPGNQQKHQQMVSYYRQKVEAFWRAWRPMGNGRIVPGVIVGVR